MPTSLSHRETSAQSELVARAYQNRSVATLKPIKEWSDRETALHLQHNRILQHNFSDIFQDPALDVSANHSPGHAVIQLALDTKEDWLTDFICPSVENACRLNIAADLVTRFKVSSDDLERKTQSIFQWITDNQISFLSDIQRELKEKVETDTFQVQIDSAAKKAFDKKYSDTMQALESEALLAKFRLVERERSKKNLLTTLLKAKLSDIYQSLPQSLQSDEKTVYVISQNHDICCLGAPGSGKSSITKQILNDGDKLNYISLATDDYRGITFAAQENEDPDTGFIRTQDSAYLLKELVDQRLQSMPDARPNVLIDCVSLESWHKKLLENNAHTDSIVACLDDMEGAIIRAFSRGTSAENPADKRHVNTSSLISGHARASRLLLDSIPHNVETLLYDTNVPRGSKPILSALIDTRDHKKEIKVIELAGLANFLVKSNLQEGATFRGALYRDVSLGQNKARFTAGLHDKAEACLNLVRTADPTKPSYTLFLSTSQSAEAYAKIGIVSGKLTLTVLNTSILNTIIAGDSLESDILKKILMQIHYGSKEAAQREERILGTTIAETIAKKHASSVPPSMIFSTIAPHSTSPASQNTSSSHPKQNPG